VSMGGECAEEECGDKKKSVGHECYDFLGRKESISVVEMRIDHLVFHVPRCGGSSLELVLIERSTGGLLCDRIEDGELVLKTIREQGEGPVVVVSQNPLLLDIAENVYLVMRDPVDRAVSLYHHLEEIGIDSDFVAWNKKSLAEYLKGDQLEHDWITKSLSGGDYHSEVTQASYHKALLTLCRSRVFLLSELDELLREMKRRGVRVDLNDKVRSRNASKGRKDLSKGEMDKIIEANFYDCKLWDLAQVMATARRDCTGGKSD
jgi:hypothetical protein